MPARICRKSVLVKRACLIGRPVLVGRFVEPTQRGLGEGRGLVEAVAAWTRAGGATHLYL